MGRGDEFHPRHDTAGRLKISGYNLERQAIANVRLVFLECSMEPVLEHKSTAKGAFRCSAPRQITDYLRGGRKRSELGRVGLKGQGHTYVVTEGARSLGGEHVTQHTDDAL